MISSFKWGCLVGWLLVASCSAQQVVHVRVLDSTNHMPIGRVSVEVVRSDMSDTLIFTTDTGTFDLHIDRKLVYDLRLSAEHYLTKRLSIDRSSLHDELHVKEVLLEPQKRIGDGFKAP